MKRLGDLVLLVIAASSLVTVTGVAWAAGMSLTSERLHAGTMAPPAFHPTAVAVTPNAKGGAAPDIKDAITVSFTRPVNIGAVCASAPDVAASGFTVTVTDGGAGNDTLHVTGLPAGCSDFRLGSFDLGTSAYLTIGSSSLTRSEITVGTSPPSITITLGSKPSPKLQDVNATTVVRYVPHPALTDSTGITVRGTAADTVQF